jgi:hypothetical protein
LNLTLHDKVAQLCLVKFWNWKNFKKIPRLVNCRKFVGKIKSTKFCGTSVNLGWIISVPWHTVCEPLLLIVKYHYDLSEFARIFLEFSRINPELPRLVIKLNSSMPIFFYWEVKKTITLCIFFVNRIIYKKQ